MKKTLFAGLLLALVFTGCSKSPSDVSEQFLEGVRTADLVMINEVSTQKTQKMTPMIVGFSKKALDAGKKAPEFEVLSEVVTGDKAVVTYKDGDSKKTLNLIKVDGDWKVEFSKK